MKTPSNSAISASTGELFKLTEAFARDMNPASLSKLNPLIKQIGQHVGHDKVLTTLVKMCNSLVGYITSNWENLNQNAIPLFRSLIQTLNQLAGTDAQISPNEKQARLSKEIAKFNAFKHQLQQQRQSPAPKSPSSQVSLAELKALILSLDWEISDETIEKLDAEVTLLITKWGKSKTHLSFLKMFQSIGQYIKKKRANTHPGAISILNSLYSGFEQVVQHPNFSETQRQEILSREVQKFNRLKDAISSSGPTGGTENQGYSPMDDLIGTKSSSNLSPVDDLIEEIHMLQDENASPGTPPIPPTSAAHPPSNPDVKEVIPDRQRTQPLPEIESRLDAFFNEDEPMGDLAYADSGDEVVPYQDTAPPIEADSQKEIRRPAIPDEMETTSLSGDDFSETPLDFTDGELDDGELTMFDEPKSNKTPQSEDDDPVVPFDMQDEFFEDESGFTGEEKSVDVHTDTERKELPSIDLSLLENVKSTVAQCMFDGNIQPLDAIAPSIESLAHQLSESSNHKKFPNEYQALLSIFNSYKKTLPLLSKESVQNGIEGMLFCLDCLEYNTDGTKRDEVSAEFTLANACERFIAYQGKLIQRIHENQELPPKNGTAATMNEANRSTPSAAMPSHDTIAGRPDAHLSKDIPTDEIPTQQAADADEPIDESDEEAPKGFWAKLKRLFGG